MALASAMDIKQFEEKFHEHFADPEEEAKAAKALAEHEAQIKQQHEEYVQGKANFDEEINEFADMDDDEFAEEKLGLDNEPPVTRTFGGQTFYLGRIHNPEDRNTPEEIAELDEIYAAIDRETLPKSYDSRAHGLVTSVKDQGACGSCVAFGTTAALESNLLKAGASMKGLDVSDQHLVDCGKEKGYAGGCNGAAPHAYARFYNNEGKEMVHESTYPYVMKENNFKCQQTTYWHPGYKIAEGKWDLKCTEEKLMKLVYQYGAVSTGVYVDSGFQAYKKGVYDKCGNKSPNHSVVVVGWGTENGIDYWLVKNSWGTWWGDKGYIKIKKGTCGMVDDCVFFNLKSAGGKTTTVKPTTVKPTTKACNMVKVFGKLNGDETLKLTSNGKHFTSEVNCVDGVCKAKNPNIIDSCHYICGNKTCDHVEKLPECKDRDDHCPYLAKYYCKGFYEGFMKKYCKKSCNLC